MMYAELCRKSPVPQVRLFTSQINTLIVPYAEPQDKEKSFDSAIRHKKSHDVLRSLPLEKPPNELREVLPASKIRIGIKLEGIEVRAWTPDGEYVLRPETAPQQRIQLEMKSETLTRWIFGWLNLQAALEMELVTGTGLCDNTAAALARALPFAPCSECSARAARPSRPSSLFSARAA